MANDNRHEVTGWAGWVGFAGYMMIFSGILQFAYGIGALLNQNWLVYGSGHAYWLSLQTWGWVLLLTGALVFASGVMLLRGNALGRALGVVLVSLNALTNLALLGVTPLWSTIALIVDGLVLYAITAHGSEMRELHGQYY